MRRSNARTIEKGESQWKKIPGAPSLSFRVFPYGTLVVSDESVSIDQTQVGRKVIAAHVNHSLMNKAQYLILQSRGQVYCSQIPCVSDEGIPHAPTGDAQFAPLPARILRFTDDGIQSEEAPAGMHGCLSVWTCTGNIEARQKIASDLVSVVIPGHVSVLDGLHTLTQLPLYQSMNPLCKYMGQAAQSHAVQVKNTWRKRGFPCYRVIYNGLGMADTQYSIPEPEAQRWVDIGVASIISQNPPQSHPSEFVMFIKFPHGASEPVIVAISPTKVVEASQTGSGIRYHDAFGQEYHATPTNGDYLPLIGLAPDGVRLFLTDRSGCRPTVGEIKFLAARFKELIAETEDSRPLVPNGPPVSSMNGRVALVAIDIMNMSAPALFCALFYHANSFGFNSSSAIRKRRRTAP